MRSNWLILCSAVVAGLCTVTPAWAASTSPSDSSYSDAATNRSASVRTSMSNASALSASAPSTSALSASAPSTSSATAANRPDTNGPVVSGSNSSPSDATSKPVRQGHHVTYQVVTNEIAARQKDGSTIEVYRFDPGVYVANQGDEVTLRIRGLKGQTHPFVVTGYNIRGTVHRNETAVVSFKANKPGIFPLICTAHSDEAHEGPMEAYLVVVPKNR